MTRAAAAPAKVKDIHTRFPDLSGPRVQPGSPNTTKLSGRFCEVLRAAGGALVNAHGKKDASQCPSWAQLSFMVDAASVIQPRSVVTEAGGDHDDSVAASRIGPTGGATMTDGTRILVRQVLGAIAQYERALIRSRMAAGRAAKLATGGYSGGRPPFGWRAEGKELVPDEREQGVIALARNLAQEGLSSRQVAARLEEAGHRPKVGERWSSVQVGRLLRARG